MHACIAVSFLWQTAAKILEGPAKSWKLLVLAVFLIGVGTLLEVLYKLTTGAAIFILLGICAFILGLIMYKKDIEHEKTNSKTNHNHIAN